MSDVTARHLATRWPVIRKQLLAGTYRPSAACRVAIHKPDGGQRELGIPTVTDRLIRQALLQVLRPMLDPTGWRRQASGQASNATKHRPATT